MEQRIGFANKYYTLWEVYKKTRYYTTEDGKSYPYDSGEEFVYVKNISFDLDKVKLQYPNINIDMDLKSTKTFFKSSIYKNDLSPHILKFGKYRDRLVDDILKEDPDYIKWAADNAYSPVQREFIKNHPLYLDILKKENDKLIELKKKLPIIETDSFVDIEINFSSNPNTPVNSITGVLEILESQKIKLDDNARVAYSVPCENWSYQLLVIFPKIKCVDGLYPYNMAIIGNKAKRLKGKTLSLPVQILGTIDKSHDSFVNVKQVALYCPSDLT